MKRTVSVITLLTSFCFVIFSAGPISASRQDIVDSTDKTEAVAPAVSNEPLRFSEPASLEKNRESSYWGANVIGDIWSLNSGNVGIGTNAPEYKFQVSGGDAYFSNRLFVGEDLAVNGRFLNLYGTPTTGIGFGNGACLTQTESGFTFACNSGIWDFSIGDVAVSSGDLQITSGNIILGNRPAVAKLHVEGDGYFSGPVTVGEPVDNDQAATKNYVDSNITAIAVAGDSFWGGETFGNIWSLNSGNVGIGLSNTSTIPVRLTIEESFDGVVELLRLQNPGIGSAGTQIGFYMGEPSTEQARILVRNNSIQFGLGSAGTEAMRIHTGGNVGIGTNAPSAKLHVKGIANGVQFVIQANSVQSISNPLIKLLDSAGNELARLHSDAASNIFLGYLSGNANAYFSPDIGAYNVFIGSEAGRYNTLGMANTAVGGNSLLNNTTGSSNVSIGHKSLYENVSGSNNTAIGDGALYTNDAYDNGAGGNNNTAVGFQAMYSNLAGINNTALGYQSLFFSQAGEFNTGSGYQSLYSNTDGVGNVANGAFALWTSGNGYYNTAAGYRALYNNDANYNTAYGAKALEGLTYGESNIALGYRAGDNLTTGSNNIIIGYDVNAPSATADGQLNIGNAIYGDLSSGYISIGTSSPESELDVHGTIKMRNFTITQPEDVINKGYLDSVLADLASGTSSNAIFTNAVQINNLDSQNEEARLTIDSTLGVNQSALLMLTGETARLGFASADSNSQWSMGLNTELAANPTGDFKITNTLANRSDFTIMRDTGNVLIGTSTPSNFKLKVSGNARITGNLSAKKLIVNQSITAAAYIAPNGQAGASHTYALKNSNGQDCLMVFSAGLMTTSTCQIVQ